MEQNTQRKILTRNKVILLKQIRSCKVKGANLTFDLDQIKVAEQAFTTAFLSSIEKSKEDEEKVDSCRIIFCFVT